MPTDLLSRLRTTPADASVLWELSEFGVLEGDAPDWFALDTGEPLEVVGGDGSGGRFCLLPAPAGHPRRLLHIDSEGSAGTIADSLAEGIAMMIALPYWRDCLKFSGGGVLGQMQRAQARLEADLQKDDPGVDGRRWALYRAFGLTPPSAPLEALHQAVTSGAGVRVVATGDGSPFDGLFNTFVIDDWPR